MLRLQIETETEEISKRKPAPILTSKLKQSVQVQQADNFNDLVKRAAHECSILGARFIGNSAPSQLNISGETVHSLESALQVVDELIKSNSTDELENAIAVTLGGLAAVQIEVYELLRKDSYPRFLLTSEAQSLNQNSDLKRMLAAEKMEQEVHHSVDTHKAEPSGSTHSNNSESDAKTKTKEGSANKASKEGSATNQASRKRASFFVDLIGSGKKIDDASARSETNGVAQSKSCENESTEYSSHLSFASTDLSSPDSSPLARVV